MTRRVRFTATVEADLLAAARRSVRQGRADSVSAWVNEALARQVERDEKLRAMREFLGDYEREHGAFTEEEVREIKQRLRARTIDVRPSMRQRQAARPRKRRSAA
jgi:hypothetical protein